MANRQWQYLPIFGKTYTYNLIYLSQSSRKSTVAQASSSWQQLINQLPKWVLTDLRIGVTRQQNLQRYQGPGGLLGFVTIVLAMLLWNWKLLLASAVGIGMMVMVYSMYRWDWQKNWYEVRQFFRTPHSRLTIAVASGGISCVITYMAAAVWVDSSSHWIAASAILQALGTLLALILLVWQFTNFYGIREENYVDKLLANLTAKDSVKRLLAVRQLTKLRWHKRLDTELQQHVADCLQLLLSQEEETIIYQAALEALQNFEQSHVFPASKTKPFKVFPKVTAKVKQRVY